MAVCREETLLSMEMKFMNKINYGLNNRKETFTRFFSFKNKIALLRSEKVKH
jgi:hypothetical protein